RRPLSMHRPSIQREARVAVRKSAPIAELLVHAPVVRVGEQPLGPPPERGSLPRQPRRLAPVERLAGRLQVLEATAPRDSVHHEVVDDEEEPWSPLPSSREPHGPPDRTSLEVEPALRLVGDRLDRPARVLLSETVELDLAQSRRGAMIDDDLLPARGALPES